MAQQLPPSARVLTLGSCFADSIGTRLATHKVNVVINPFGTVFQPLAVGRLLRAALGENVDWQQHLVEARGRWQSYDLHGSQGAPTPVELLHNIQQTVRRTGDFLRGADAVLLTLGTAWAYRLRETGELVSNCHKMPAELFEKELLTPDEIINALAETHAYLRRINPRLRIILTVSPVRHLRDTLPLNAVSKSVLRVACHYLSELLPEVSYFPAYELLTDDLRDYRFYAADMLHPSEVAEDYVWEKFTRTYFDADFGRFRKEWAGLSQALGHRPLNAAAPEHRQFLVATRERLERLSRQRVNVAAELREVDEQLATLPVPADIVVPEPELEGQERVDIGNTKIGEASTSAIAAANVDGALATGNERPARLSPEEFRAQQVARGNRPKRGRREEHSTDLSPKLAGAAVTANAATTDSLAVPIEAFDDSVTEASSIIDGAELDPTKRKQRRSRGGAKRTARKNAAKLAASGENEAPVAAEPDTASTGGPTLPRNPQPEARKSSIITKSIPVKRGGRGRDRSQDEAIQVEEIPNTPASALVEDAVASQLGTSPQPNTSELASQANVLTSEITAPVNERSNNRRNQGPRTRPLFATPTQGAPDASDNSETVNNSAVTSQPAPAATAKKSTRRRPSPITETPPMMPIVPIRTEVRTAGVAAGRMRGSDATLIASAPAPKAIAPKAAVPKVALPEATVPKAAVLKKTTPEAATPKYPAAKTTALAVPSPEAAVVSATVAEPDALRAKAPKAAAPKATAPKAAAPKATAPKAAAPKAAAPKATAPKATAPKATAPKAAAPKATAPKAAAPKATAPKAAAPKAAAPKAAAPKATAPKAAAPKAAAPKAAAPKAAGKRPAKPRAKKAAGSPDSAANSDSPV